MSSEWGRNFSISIFGESHGEGIGVTINGAPAGIPIDRGALLAFMARRAPGKDKTSTPRQESDLPETLSGIYQGKTTGAPIAAVIRNRDTRSGDYSEFSHTARPGHADYTAFLRYGGFHDPRGGGHFSGRLTAPLCYAGGIAKQILESRGVLVGAHIAEIAGILDSPFDSVALDAETLLRPGKSVFPVLDSGAGQSMRDAIEEARMSLDSVGGVVECAAIGFPGGIGSPMFGGIENRAASILFGIPAVKGVEFGAGFAAAKLRGSANNDPFRMEGEAVRTIQNNAGGILGGISTGMPILVRAAFKPTPSISQEQKTVDFLAGENCGFAIKGRHDPCVVVRAVSVVEAAMAAALLDCLLEAEGYQNFPANAGALRG